MLEDVSTNIDEVVKQFVTKIYAHPNGDSTVHLGVAHFRSSGREIRTRYKFSQTRINTEFLYLQRCYLVLPFTLIMLLQYIPAFHSLSCY